MRAIEVAEHGGPDVLTPVDRDPPTPGAGEVLVRTTAIGVNYIDTYLREGSYRCDLPYIPGTEGAGLVEAVGAGTPDLVVGDRVSWCQVPGSYAQFVVAPAQDLVTVPDGIPDHIAASMLLQGLTAHYLISDTHRAAGGDTVLITAGAGGVGQLLIQMAVARGFRVIATTSTEAKAQLCRELGAHQVLLYPDATPERVRDLTEGGVSVVFDGIGLDTFDSSLASLARRGTLVLFGAASGPVPPVDPQRLNAAGSVFLTRPTLADFIASTGEYRMRAAEVMDALVDGSLTLTVGETFALSDAAAAHRALHARQTTGSITLDPTR